MSLPTNHRKISGREVLLLPRGSIVAADRDGDSATPIQVRGGGGTKELEFWPLLTPHDVNDERDYEKQVEIVPGLIYRVYFVPCPPVLPVGEKITSVGHLYVLPAKAIVVDGFLNAWQKAEDAETSQLLWHNVGSEEQLNDFSLWTSEAKLTVAWLPS